MLSGKGSFYEFFYTKIYHTKFLYMKISRSTVLLLLWHSRVYIFGWWGARFPSPEIDILSVEFPKCT